MSTEPGAKNAKRARPRRRGAFVVLVGPDGAGKTTVAREIVARRRGPTGYFHFLPTPRRALAAGPPTAPDAPPPKAQGGGSRAAGWLRLFRNAARWWLAYVGQIGPAVRAGTLVVGDRWLYGYLVQPGALKYAGPPGLARAVLRLLPSPDLVVNLSAPAAVIRARKQELTLDDIETELQGWAGLPSDRLRTFDATAAPEVIAAQVLQALDQLEVDVAVPLGVARLEHG